MTWVKLDDGFFRNRRARLAGKDGRALFLASLCHCAAALTDGHITRADLPVLASEAEVRQNTSKTLVEVGLWMPVEDGWIIHDYEHYNRSADSVRREREEGRQRALRSWERRKSSGEESPKLRAKNTRSFAVSSHDQSSPVQSPVTYMGESSSSPTAATVDDEPPDWAIKEATRRLADRPAHLPIVLARQRWIQETAIDIAKQPRPETRLERLERLAASE